MPIYLTSELKFFEIIKRIVYHIDVNIMSLKRKSDENTNRNEQIAKEKVEKKTMKY